MAFTHLQTIPILRSFDEAKMREFYLGWLGFTVDFEHRFEPGMLLYMQVSRDGLVLHLSEHHGDTSPAVRIYVRIKGIEALHAELISKQYQFNRPSLEHPEWGGTEMTVIDPFHNRITFADADA